MVIFGRSAAIDVDARVGCRCRRLGRGRLVTLRLRLRLVRVVRLVQICQLVQLVCVVQICQLVRVRRLCRAALCGSRAAAAHRWA